MYIHRYTQYISRFQIQVFPLSQPRFAGRLPVSFPSDPGQQPLFYNAPRTGRPQRDGPRTFKASWREARRFKTEWGQWPLRTVCVAKEKRFAIFKTFLDDFKASQLGWVKNSEEKNFQDSTLVELSRSGVERNFSDSKSFSNLGFSAFFWVWNINLCLTKTRSLSENMESIDIKYFFTSFLKGCDCTQEITSLLQRPSPGP